MSGLVEGTFPFEMRRVTALIGPYGSGKTELAIAMAIHAMQAATSGGPFQHVALADLDVLKPYFRSREAGDRLTPMGIRLLAPEGALANSDLPILTPEIRGSLQRADMQLVLDVGGDPVGARALGSLSDVVAASEYDLLLVLNRYRPFMDSVDSVVAQARNIAAASLLTITGLVSNTHILDDTTAQDVEWGLDLAREVSSALSVPIRLLAVPRALAPQFDKPGLPPVVGIARHILPSFLGGVVLAQRSATQQRRTP